MAVHAEQRIREPLPLGISLRWWVFLPCSIALFSLPLLLGMRGTGEQEREGLMAEGYTVIKGVRVEIEGSDLEGRTAVLAGEGVLRGTFSEEFVFTGRRLVLEPGVRLPVLRVRCAVIEGDRGGVGELRGSYQRLR